MMSPPRDLSTLQHWMQSVIMHPAGLQPGLQSPEAQRRLKIAPHELDQVILPSNRRTSFQRLEIYSNSYVLRLIDCLQSEFPALLAALGEEMFTQFALDYLHACPSESYTLTDLGARFPRFLQDTRPPRETDGVPDWADFLIDLARLERLYSEVFDGPGAEHLPPLSPETLSALQPEQWQYARLVPAPCLKLIELQFPVHEYISAVRRNQAEEIPAPQHTWLAVTRRDFVVRRHALEPVEYDLLHRLLSGEAVGSAVEAASRRAGDLDDFAQRLRQWFAAWAAARFFLEIKLPPP